MTASGWRARRDRWRYRRAVRRAFARVTFYREQWAAAGRVLAEPDPTPAAALPQPPHTLCPFARPWSPEHEPSLWTSDPWPLARALRMAGCRENLPVLEVREALLDRTQLPRLHRLGRPGAYRVLLPAGALVASADRRVELNRRALEVAAAAGAGWVVGSPDELAALPEAASELLRPVYRLPVAALAGRGPVDQPAVLHEPGLGYLGAVVPECRHAHLDRSRVYARDRAATLTLSLLRSRRPTLLDIVPPRAGALTVTTCARHGTPILAPRQPARAAPA